MTTNNNINTDTITNTITDTDTITKIISSLEHLSNERCYDDGFLSNRYFEGECLFLYAGGEFPEYNNRMLIYFDYSHMPHNNGKYLLWVLRNPSDSSREDLGKLLLRILQYMENMNGENKFQGVFIMNLCSLCTVNTTGDNINNTVEDNCNEFNKNIFDAILCKFHPKVIFSTGNNVNINDTHTFLMNERYNNIEYKCFRKNKSNTSIMCMTKQVNNNDFFLPFDRFHSFRN